jgi:HAD superfamily hydrolase (TIGR01549 family)
VPDTPGPPHAGDLDRPEDATSTGVLDVPDTVEEDLDELDFDPPLHPDREHDGPAPRFVVFDVGEVLIDETRVWSCWAQLVGTTPFTFAAVMGAAIVQGEDPAAVFDHIAPNVVWPDFEEEHERRYGGFREDDLYTDARPCLHELRELGFGVSIVGNQPARRRDQLVALDLPHDHLATSADLGVEKPAPGFFDAVLELVGAASPDQVLYVGDRIDNDILPAHAHGIRTCWIRRGPWGQLQDPPGGVEPDLVLEGLGELPLLLQQWRGD